MKMYREIIFRGRKKDTGEWVEGNYFHNIRKGESHSIFDKESNIDYEIYRESLQMKGYNGEWEQV